MVFPAGTWAVIVVEPAAVNDVAGMPLNRTPVTPVNPIPAIVTDAPGGAFAGLKPVAEKVTMGSARSWPARRCCGR